MDKLLTDLNRILNQRHFAKFDKLMTTVEEPIDIFDPSIDETFLDDEDQLNEDDSYVDETQLIDPQHLAVLKFDIWRDVNCANHPHCPSCYDQHVAEYDAEVGGV